MISESELIKSVKTLSVCELIEAVKTLRENTIKFEKVKNQKEADLLNKADKILGLESSWKIGDEIVPICKGTIGS